jgi:hypothetical protein
VARRKAAYYAAIATNSDFRGRLEAVDPVAPPQRRDLDGGGLSAAG